jgi:hypothetical protein
VASWVLDWSGVTGLASTALPGLVTRSTFVGTPVCRSACVVSTRQADVAALPSEKSRVVVPPSVTTSAVKVTLSKLVALAVMLGYVPAGSGVNE